LAPWVTADDGGGYANADIGGLDDGISL